MLARRTLDLQGPGSGLAQSFISRDTLLDIGRAEDILEQAHIKAERIREQALAEREALLARTQAECWHAAEAVLTDWEQERQAMWANIEESARHLVNEALNTLLEEIPDDARIRAVLRQISHRLSAPVDGTLYTHPDDLPSLRALVEQREDNLWTVRGDPALPRQHLRLLTESGDFRLEWNEAVQRLLLPSGGC